ncbi:competence protein CoiA family protein [Streptomyces pseudovenezuelae]|uniref:competence protein CoiA family protein n=1 Tax=Streptomyces pseudovenezuelae TaxID=67350 RepID=UPI00371C9D96
MANGVFHTGRGIEINLTHQDLDNPDYAGLLDEITQPVGQRPRNLLQCLKDYRDEECQCALVGKSPWMFVRRQRSNGRVTWVAAHLPLTHTATLQESDKHKAMKERIARTAARHGLDVQIEARSQDGRVITDVLVTGAGARVGWEAQYSPITANTVRRRSAKARERNIAPLWVTADDTSALIDRAPWARVDDVPWQRIVSPLALIIRGGVRHLQIWKCTPSSERPCPETGSTCGKWHSGWSCQPCACPRNAPQRWTSSLSPAPMGNTCRYAPATGTMPGVPPICGSWPVTFGAGARSPARPMPRPNPAQPTTSRSPTPNRNSTVPVATEKKAPTPAARARSGT